MQQIFEFIGNHSLLVMAFVAVLGMLAWNVFGDSLNGAKKVAPQEAVLLINHEDAVVIDVRDTKEFVGGHIIDALHIPLASLNKQIGSLEKYKDHPIITTCLSGARSGQASAILQKQGFSQVCNMKGGIMAWQSASLPLVSGAAKKAKKNKSKAAA